MGTAYKYLNLVKMNSFGNAFGRQMQSKVTRSTINDDEYNIWCNKAKENKTHSINETT